MNSKQTTAELSKIIDLSQRAIENFELASVEEKHQFATKNGPKIYVNQGFINKCKKAIIATKKNRTLIKEKKKHLIDYCDFIKSVDDAYLVDNKRKNRAFADGEKTGEWKYYNENGELLMVKKH